MKTALAVLSVLVVLAVGGTITAQHGRTDAPLLLGIVTVPGEKETVVIAYVLPKSPAAKAKLKAGDRVLSIGKAKPKGPDDVEKALKGLEAGKAVTVVVRREKKKVEAKVTPIERKNYRGDYLKAVARGSTGGAAPEWFGYAWANVKKGEEPPTRANTKGKVVVFHAFQSW